MGQDLHSKIGHFVRERLPEGGLFANQHWRVAIRPFPLGPTLASELEALNLLYRHSLEGKQPLWVAQWLDLGKPASLLEIQRSKGFKNELPRVIRPDLLLTENGISLTELDSVPGGIGLTAWLNQTYADAADHLAEWQGDGESPEKHENFVAPIGGRNGMVQGFSGIFGNAERVHIIVSEESASYQPEMRWLAQQAGPGRFQVRDTQFSNFNEGDAVYRFFELFDLANVKNAEQIFSQAAERKISLTPPPKPIFEEKMLFALLWNRNLQPFWRRELGESFFEKLLKITPYSWIVDPAPLPPQGAYPEIQLTDWNQLKELSQKQRDLILKVSGYSEQAWGARGVYLGSDLALPEWSVAVDQALANFQQSPFILQRYQKPKTVPFEWYDFESETTVAMPGRVRLCPYYFVHGQAESARAQLGGVLATVCPADKKIIHGMTDAVLAPCVA